MKSTVSPETYSSINNILEFWWQEKTLNFHTVLPVIILENNGDGSVDVQTLILPMDADDKALDPIKIYNVPILSLSAGKATIKLDPKKDDIGLMAVCERDISTLSETKKEATPDTYRRFSLSDGIYLGAILYDQSSASNSIIINDEQIEFKTEKSTINITENINMDSENFNFNASSDITIDGNNVNITGTKVVVEASNNNAVSILKDAVDKLATACSLPTAPGKPVITPADLVLIQVELAKLSVFE